MPFALRLSLPSPPPAARRRPLAIQPAIISSLIFLLAASVSPAVAFQPAPASGAIELGEPAIGLAGAVKLGVWTPVRIEVTAEKASPATLEWTVLDGDGAPVSYRDAAPLQLIAGKQSVVRYVKIGRAGGSLGLTLRTSEGSPPIERQWRLSSLARLLTSGDDLLVTIGDDVGLDTTIGDRRRRDDRLWHVRLDSAEQLPDRWYGYDAADALIIADSEAQLLPRLSPAQAKAIEEWVLQGGHAIFSAGAHAERWFAGDSPWTLFAAGEDVSVENAGKASGLEIFAGASARLEVLELKVARFAEIRGDSLAYEGREPSDRPWIIRHPLGFGEVTLLTFDLAAKPLAAWPDRPKLLTKLLKDSFERSTVQAKRQQAGGSRQAGYDDLSSQLRGSLDRFGGVRIFAFSAVAAILIVYVLLIGPGDYFLLKRLKRLEWTWLTFPAIVLAFCGLAAGLASQWQSHDMRLNQLELIDVDLTSSQVRGVTWTHLYSPRNDSYNLTLRVGGAEGEESNAGGVESATFDWHGSPGETMGGAGDAGLHASSSQPYVIETPPEGDGASPKIDGLPIQISSTKSLIGRWAGEQKLGVDWKLTVDENGMLHGEIGNPLDVELFDCRVYFGRLAYQIDGRLKPGEIVSIDDLPSPRTLEWTLAKKKIVESEDVSTPWDRSSADTARILEIMLFHEAVGGGAYTDLENRYQGRLDLSRRLNNKRAILIGRADTPRSELQRDGQSLSESYDRRYSYYRVMAPVAPAAPSR